MRRAAPRVPRYSAVGQARPFFLRARGEDEPPVGIEPMTGARARAQRRAKEKIMQRAVLGIEPRTSRTRSENHATRPNSRIIDLLRLPMTVNKNAVIMRALVRLLS